MEKNMTAQELPSNNQAFKAVSFFSRLALAIGIAFFSYSAYAATVLGKGSSQIFIGVAFLLMMLGSCFLTRKLMQVIHQL
jgi:hypothetical protein